MDALQLRKLIPATERMVYLNTGWAGPSPEPVLERMYSVLTDESNTGPASTQWLHQSREIKQEALHAVASLLHVPAEELLLTHGTTEGINIVLHGLPWQPGDELVTCDLEHPAIMDSAAALSEHRGVRTTTVEIPPDASAAEVLDRVREGMGPDTKLVALSHIQYSCGLRLPIQELAEVVHRAGALLLVDGAQAMGHIALDLTELGADFYAASGQKWLLGPTGTGVLHAAWDRLPLLEPVLSKRSHISQGEHPMRRFALTSQSVALLAGLAEATHIALELDPVEMERHSLRLASRLKEALAGVQDCTVAGPTHPEASSGLVSITVSGWDPKEMVMVLWYRFRIAARAVEYPAAIRFCTASFNTDEEVDQVAAAIAQLAKEYFEEEDLQSLLPDAG